MRQENLIQKNLDFLWMCGLNEKSVQAGLHAMAGLRF